MNLTTIGNSSTWKNPRNRTIIVASGVALALSVAIGGISALPDSGSRQASVTPVTQSQPSTLFQTSADAVFAAESGVAVTPRFANSVDAVEASVALALANQPTVSAHETYFGLGQPGERSASIENELAAIAAAEIAAFGVPISDLLPTTSQAQEAFGLGQPGERSASIENELAAVAAAEIAAFGVPISDLLPTTSQAQEAFGLGQPGERSSSVTPQFANAVDAYEASIAGLFAPPYSGSLGTNDYAGMEVAGVPSTKAATSPFSGSLGLNDYAGMEVAGIPAPATTAPQFATMSDAVEALWYLEVQQVSVAPGLAQPVSPSVDSPDAYLGLGQPGERSVIPQLFSNYVDAWEASVR